MPSSSARWRVIARAFVLLNGDGSSQVSLNCSSYPLRTASRMPFASAIGACFNTSSKPVDVYSGYRSISPLTSAVCATGVAPRLNLRSTRMPASSSASAYISATRMASVKFFDPMRTGAASAGAGCGAAVGCVVCAGALQAARRTPTSVVNANNIRIDRTMNLLLTINTYAYVAAPRLDARRRCVQPSINSAASASRATGMAPTSIIRVSNSA